MEPTRTGLAVLWALVALAACRNAWRRGARRWYVCAAVSAALATVAVWRWHVRLLRLGQRGLRELGLYESRMVAKVAIAVVLGLAAVLVARYARAPLRRSLRGTGRALAPAFAAAAFLALLTLSLDDFMPRIVSAPPGRFVIEYTLALLALLGACLAREAGADHGAD